MKRIIIVACLLALVVCLAVSVSADPIIQPLELYFGGYRPVNSSYVREVYTANQSFAGWSSGPGGITSGQLNFQNTNLGVSTHKSWRYLPFGAKNLDISRLAGSSVTMELPFNLAIATDSPTANIANLSISATYYFYLADGTRTRDKSLSYDYNGFDYVFTASVNVPENASELVLNVYFSMNIQHVVSVRTYAVPSVPPLNIYIQKPFAEAVKVVDPYANGKVTFNNQTERVVFQSNFSDYEWFSSTGAVGLGSQFEFKTKTYQLGDVQVEGYPFDVVGVLPLDGLEEGSSIGLSLEVTTRVNDLEQSHKHEGVLIGYFYDSKYALIKTVDLQGFIDFNVFNSAVTNYFDVHLGTDDLGDASYLRLVYKSFISGVEDENNDAVVEIVTNSSLLSVEMTYASAFQLQQQGKITNQKLDEVQQAIRDTNSKLDDTNDKLDDTNDKLDDTNEKLDEIINGTVEGKPPQGSDIVGDLEDQEGGIRDDASIQFGEAEDLQASALDVIFMYAGAFSAFSLIFDAFTSIPLFTGLLYVSVAIGIFSFVLGLGLDAAGSARRNDYRNTGRKKGSGD